MSVRLTSSGLQGDYGRQVYTIYFNGAGYSGVNFPIGSVVQLGRVSSMTTVRLTGKWSGVVYAPLSGIGMRSITDATSVAETYELAILQRVS